MKRFFFLVSFFFVLVGCGRPFDVKTAPGFVELENQTQYDYRATTPEGVVVGVRVVEDEKRGDLGFWTQSVLLELRDVRGYALLSSTDVESVDGTKGKRLEFGHDEDGKPYTYWLTLYLAQGRVFLVEAGGAKETFERAKAGVDWTMKSVKVRCSIFVSPVLASRTCNRW
jgi:hypothetical protein